MNIIEKEIAKRKEIIQSKNEKLEKAEEFKKVAEELENEALAINADFLLEEIMELEAFLPQKETSEENTEQVVGE